MARTRQQNVTAAQWSSNGTALGSPDLTVAGNQVFGANVFSPTVQRHRLPKHVYRALQRTLARGEALDTSLADAVAQAMKDWAMEKGATHYTHWFQPLTGSTAEKHDSFYGPDGEGSALAEFSGKELIQGEPDASSFPSGGIRATFEARGYTAWDVTSPAYILENPNGTTLCIPTAFVSWTGEALDKKTPLLRSMQALNSQAQRILKLFGHVNPAQVVSFAGCEQEYFLIDRHFYFSRPDLLATGRTLFGSPPPKGQEFEDHYLGAIPERVLAFMLESERELFKLGIPAKTRHNEVAPGQFELAPMFENGNLATDHQQLTMVTLRRVAEKYGMVCLLHEKPFAGVNGSGKHVNYSIGNATQGNLLDPGDTPHANAQFLVFCGAIIRAAPSGGGLLRAAWAPATNDHRLGANEAPPAIISIFLGDQLTDVFDQIAKGGAKSSKEKGSLTIGVDTLPVLPTDPGDRNRTSPFAFTGNRFEFRAPGALQSIAGPMVTINTILAEALDYMATGLETMIANGTEFNVAVQNVLQEVISAHGNVVFNGNGYTAPWQAEAAERGLPNLRTTLDALPQLVSGESLELFSRYGVFSHREMHSRYEIALEQYVLSIGVEARLMLEMANTMILPAATRYQTELATNLSSLHAIKATGDTMTFDEVSKAIADLRAGITSLRHELSHDDAATSEAEARHAQDGLLPAMVVVLSAAYEFEALIADDLWPLADYQEMLYIL